MILVNWSSFSAVHFIMAVLAGAMLPLVQLETYAREATKSASIDYTPEQTAALDALDASLVRFDALLRLDPDASHRAIVTPLLDGFRDRRNGMRTAPFDQGKYDDLKFVIAVEYVRLSMWLGLATPIPGRIHTFEVARSHGTQEFAIYDVRPSTSDSVEIKSALDALDREIRSQEAFVNGLSSGAMQDRERKRIAVIKERRAELGKEFSPSRWDALVAELRPIAGRIRP
jgi:hypothetical protein